MVVLDASVVNKLFLPNESNRDQARKLLQLHLNQTSEIIVPDLLFYEVANTLGTKSDIPEEQVQDNINELYSYSFQVQPLTQQLIIAAVKNAKKLKITIYDLIYLAIAEQNNCQLITADEKFLAAVNSPRVIPLNSYKI